MESFWSTLKSELVHRCSFADLPHAARAINDYIHNFYNPKRLHALWTSTHLWILNKT
jgi:transposase InsO family protein